MSQLKRNNYLTANKGNFQQELKIFSKLYSKIEDLRYGTNPHQTAAFYCLKDHPSPIGEMKIIKSGKNGLSQTNLEDISNSLNICKYFSSCACVVAKHVNPSGFALAKNSLDAYLKAKDCDPRAAFGSVVTFNQKVDIQLAQELMKSFVECVVAPEFTNQAIEYFFQEKMNKHIRIIQIKDISSLAKFVDDKEAKELFTLKFLADGSFIIAEPLLSAIKSIQNLEQAKVENKKGKIISNISISDEIKTDLLTSWYVNLGVRSNAIVILKNSSTLSIGTGEQDRIGALEQAIDKYYQKYQGEEEIKGAVLSSDGFFPFPDSIELAAKHGIKAIITPSGSIKDYEVIETANKLNIAIIFAQERIFSHH